MNVLCKPRMQLKKFDYGCNWVNFIEVYMAFLAVNLVRRTGITKLNTQIVERFSGRLPGYIGTGNDIESYCHVEDVARGHVAAMYKGRLGERYLLTGENVSFKQVFDRSALITGTRKPWFHIPLWLIEIYGWISVFFAKVSGKLPLISYPTVRVLRHQWAYSCDKAKEELGYNPRSLNEGLVEVLSWLKSLGFIKY